MPKAFRKLAKNSNVFGSANGNDHLAFIGGRLEVFDEGSEGIFADGKGRIRIEPSAPFLQTITKQGFRRA